MASTKYADLLAKMITKHGTKVWLVNTRWIQGKPGVGNRIQLKYTRAMIDAIHDGSINDEVFNTDQFFNLSVPEKCPNVPSDVLHPNTFWDNADEYNSEATKLKTLFDQNNQKYQNN